MVYLCAQFSKNIFMLSFDNTEIAFKIKSNASLKKANWLFGIINNPTFVKIGTTLAQVSLNMHLPVKYFIKKTKESIYLAEVGIKMIGFRKIFLLMMN